MPTFFENMTASCENMTTFSKELVTFCKKLPIFIALLLLQMIAHVRDEEDQLKPWPIARAALHYVGSVASDNLRAMPPNVKPDGDRLTGFAGNGEASLTRRNTLRPGRRHHAHKGASTWTRFYA